MRVLLLGNNWVAWQVIRRLRESNDDIVGLVIHPANKRKYGEEIVHTAQVSPENIFDASRLGEPDTLEAIKALRADIALSVLFDYILRQEFLELPSCLLRCVVRQL